MSEMTHYVILFTGKNMVSTKSNVTVFVCQINCCSKKSVSNKFYIYTSVTYTNTQTIEQHKTSSDNTAKMAKWY